MSTPSSRIPTELDRHLASPAAGEIVSTSAYVERGGELVTPQAVAGLRSLRAALQKKIAGVETGSRLRRRLDVLAQYFDETAGGVGPANLPHREVTFALLYFLKGFDRIPDSVPEVGLLDDALIVQDVLERHTTALKGHWTRHQRTWPEEL
jgi:uncharacterized membrane protein YkvA (DUF1232 family)